MLNTTRKVECFRPIRRQTKNIVVDVDILTLWDAFNDVLHDVGHMNEPIPTQLPHRAHPMNETVLRKVINYGRDQITTAHTGMQTMDYVWLAHLFKVHWATLLQVIEATHAWNVPTLLDVALVAAAYRFEGMSDMARQQILNAVDDDHIPILSEHVYMLMNVLPVPQAVDDWRHYLKCHWTSLPNLELTITINTVLETLVLSWSTGDCAAPWVINDAHQLAAKLVVDIGQTVKRVQIVRQLHVVHMETLLHTLLQRMHIDEQFDLLQVDTFADGVHLPRTYQRQE